MVPSSHKITARRVVVTSFIVDALDLVINLAVAILTGSAVILSETLQGATNLISSVMLILGVRQSLQKRDETHQFGHGRDLYFWTLLSVIIILVATGTPSILIGLQRIKEPQIVENINLAFLVLGFAIVTNSYALSVSTKRMLVDKKLKDTIKMFMENPRVETKGAFLLDLMGLFSAVFGLVSLIIYKISGNIIFDGIGAVAIGVITVTLSFLSIVSIRDLLVGKSVPREMEEKIRKEIAAHKEIRKILDLRTMYMGPDNIMISTDIYLKETLTTKEIEKLVDKLQTHLQEKIPEAKFIQIETETPEVDKKEKMIEDAPEEY